MEFDIIIANPPYQDTTKSIYPDFIKISSNIKPQYLVMITRNNWLTSDTMRDIRNSLIEAGLTEIINYSIPEEIFTGIRVGVSIFSVRNGYKDITKITEIQKGIIINKYAAHLQSMPVILMSQIDYDIAQKVLSSQEESFKKEVYPQEAFRITSAMGSGRGDNSYILNFQSEKTKEFNIGVLCQNNGINYFNYIKEEDIPARADLADKYKIVVGATLNDNSNPITNIIQLEPGTVCSGTFSPIYVSSDKVKIYGAHTYIKTKFFRFLVKILCTSGINRVSGARFELVPIQDFTHTWTDQDLYIKYKFTQQEIDHIESAIKAI